MFMIPNVISIHINLLLVKFGVETLVQYHQLSYRCYLKVYFYLFGRIGFSVNIGKKRHPNVNAK